MKIVNCPKGGRVPEGYCLWSCLNRPKEGDSGHLREPRKAPAVPAANLKKSAMAGK
jgi:hypothetical protein